MNPRLGYALSILGILLRGFSFVSGLVVFCFALSYLAPGDPARSVLGPNARESDVESLRHEMGWDLPLTGQLTRYIGELAHFRLGQSTVSGLPVLTEINNHFRYTVLIGGIAVSLSLALALAINWLLLINEALRPIIPILRLGVSAPSFLIALVSALTSGSLLSSWGLGSAGAYELSLAAMLGPALAVTVYPTALMTALLRDRCIGIRISSYCRAALAYGYGPNSLFWRVMLPNSAGILASAWINQLSVVLFSTLLVEQFFSISGGGALLIRSIQAKDTPVITGVVLLNGLFFLTINAVGLWLEKNMNHIRRGLPSP